MKETVCILFIGFQNLRGDIALDFMSRFNLKPYPDTPNGRFYGDFDYRFMKDKELSMYEDLVKLFSWLSTNKIRYRFSTAYMKDNVVDFGISILPLDGRDFRVK